MLVSPGIEVREIDFSTYVAAISTTIVGMVGGAAKGGVGETHFITNRNQFLRKLGDLDENSLATHAAMEFLRQGNQLYYHRVASESAAASSYMVQDTESTSADLIELVALSPGTWGDDIEAEIIAGETATDFTLNIYYRGTQRESYECSLDSSSENYLEDVVVDSDYVDAIDQQTEAGVSIETGTFALADGDNGVSGLTASDYVGTGDEGLQAFRNESTFDINLLAVPGHSALAAVSAEMITIAEDRGDLLAIIDPPAGLTPVEMADWHNGDGSGDDDPQAALNSSYAATYWPWLEVFDAYSESNIMVPPSGHVLNVIAHNDSVGETWSAPAGLDRGTISSAIALEYNPTQGDRNLLYGNGNAVNPIVNFDQDGIVIWGQRTLQRKPSALDRINVRRLLIMLKKAIAASTRYTTFEPNDEFTWSEWTGMVEPYLEGIKNDRGLYDYFVQMDDTVVTDQDIDQNHLPGKVYLKPTKTAEFITLDFILLNTGAEFPNG